MVSTVTLRHALFVALLWRLAPRRGSNRHGRLVTDGPAALAKDLCELIFVDEAIPFVVDYLKQPLHLHQQQRLRGEAARRRG